MNFFLVVSCLCVLIFANAQEDWNKQDSYSDVQYSVQQGTNYQNLINAEYQKYYENYVQKNLESLQKLFPNLIAASIPASAVSRVNEDNSAQTVSSSSNSNAETNYNYRTSSTGSSSYKSNRNIAGGSSIYPYYIPYGYNVFSYPGFNGNGQYQGNSANLAAGIQGYANSATANFASGVQDYANSAANIAAYVAGIQNKESNSAEVAVGNRNQVGSSTTNENDEDVHQNQYLQPPEKESFNIIHGNPILITSRPLAATVVSVNLDQNKTPVSTATSSASTFVNSGNFIRTNQIHSTGASAVTSNGNPVFATGSINQTPSYLEVAPFVSSISEDRNPVHSAFATASGTTAQLTKNPASSSDIAPFVSPIREHNNPAASAATFSSSLDQNGNTGSSQFIAVSSSSPLNQNGNIGSSGSSQFISQKSSSVDVSAPTIAGADENNYLSSSPVNTVTETNPSISTHIPTEINISGGTLENKNNVEVTANAQASSVSSSPSTTNNFLSIAKAENGVFLVALPKDSNTVQNGNGYKLLQVAIPIDVLKKLLAENDEDTLKKMMVSIENKIASAVLDAQGKNVATSEANAAAVGIPTLNKVVSIENKTATTVVDTRGYSIEKNTATAEANAFVPAGNPITEKAEDEILIKRKQVINTVANAEANTATSTSTSFATPSPNPTSTTFDNPEVFLTTSSTFKNHEATSITEAPIAQKATYETTDLTKSSSVDATLALGVNLDKNLFEANRDYLIPIEGNSGYFIEFLPDIYYSNGDDQEIPITSRLTDEDELPFKTSEHATGQKVITRDNLINRVFKIKQPSSSSSIKSIKNGSASALIVNGNNKSGPRILFKYPSREVQAASTAYSSSSGKNEFKYVSNGAQRSYSKNKYYSFNRNQYGSYP